MLRRSDTAFSRRYAPKSLPPRIRGTGSALSERRANRPEARASARAWRLGGPIRSPGACPPTGGLVPRGVGGRRNPRRHWLCGRFRGLSPVSPDLLGCPAGKRCAIVGEWSNMAQRSKALASARVRYDAPAQQVRQRSNRWGISHGICGAPGGAARKPAWLLVSDGLRLRQTTTPASAGVVVWRGRAQALRPVREGFEGSGLQARPGSRERSECDRIPPSRPLAPRAATPHPGPRAKRRGPSRCPRRINTPAPPPASARP